MGYVYVTMGLANPLLPNRRLSLRLLADTGAFYSVIPAPILQRLGVKPLEEVALTVADGRRIRRQIGEALFYWREKPRTSLVVFGRKKNPPLLGVVTLETFGLEVDPKSGKLKRTELLLV